MKNILVVNNDFDTMSLLKSWLEKKSYQVQYTGSREEVPNIMTEFQPELVIVDVLQKEVIEELRENEITRSIPLLLMTGYSSRPVGIKLPVDDIIEKPFNLALLQKKIEKLIGEPVDLS